MKRHDDNKDSKIADPTNQRDVDEAVNSRSTLKDKVKIEKTNYGISITINM